MPDKRLLGLNIYGDDTHFTGQQSAFVGKTPPLLFQGSRDWRYALTKTAPVAGELFEVEIPLNGTFLGQILLDIESAAPVVSAGTGQHVEYWPYLAVQNIEAQIAGQKLQSITGLEMYAWHALTRQGENRYELLTAGGNNVTLTGAQRAQLPIPAFWTGSFANYLPYLNTVVHTPITLQVTLAQSNVFLGSSDASATLTSHSITRIRLLIEYIHSLRTETKAMISEITGVNTVLGTAGYARLCTTFARRSNVTLAQSAAEQEIQLDTFKYPLRALFMLGRVAANVRSASSLADYSGGSSFDGPFAFMSIDQLRAELNGDLLWPEFPGNFLIHYMMAVRPHGTCLCAPGRVGHSVRCRCT